jgi:putative ABC transport system ATP-binding protein
MSMLELTDIRKVYRKGERTVEALSSVTLSIEKGDFLSVVGPSGSGKSTLLNILGCLDTPTEGSVLYDGRELGKMNETELSLYRRENIAFIFQSYNLIPVLSVRENVELPLVIEKKLSKAEMAKKAMQVIEAVGLGALADRLPKELSGGQEQRVAIARALVKNPLVVLADEPTANLDSHTAEEIISIMQEMNTKSNTTFIFSTHDRMVEQHAKRVIILKDGQISRDERR